MRPFQWSALPLVLVLAATFLACDGAGSDDGGAGADGEGDATAWIVGNWSGNVRGKETDDGDDGASLVETTVDAKFKGGNDAKTGTFTFTMPQLDNVTVTGAFADFAGKSLLLTIKDSNFSALGMPGSTTDLDYELVGDALELSNNRIVLKLLRRDGEGGGEGGGGEGGGAEAPTGYPGQWSCYDQAGRTWEFSLGDGDAFDVKVFDPPTPALLMSGSYVTDKDYGVMTVTESNQIANEGIQFQMTLKNDKTLTITRMIRQDTDTSVRGESFDCARQ
jgi:hypothetical protein